jgi:RES domain-containing protein
MTLDSSDDYRHVYRIAARHYARDLSGEGARRFGGRWTPPGCPVLYTAEHPALAGFEKLVHAGVAITASPLDYRLIVLAIATDQIDRVQHMPVDPLAVGTAWYEAGEYLALEVPSVVVPYANNLLLNTQHPCADMISIQDDVGFVFDPRLNSVLS